MTTAPRIPGWPRRMALGMTATGGLAACAGPASTQAVATQSPGHVVLLGDSVLDNAGYLRGGGPDIAAQLGMRLPPGWRATLLARGGSVTADVAGQLGRLPRDATHLVISAGGNDAGRQEAVLGEPAGSVAEGLARIAAIREAFARDYRTMLDAARGSSLPIAVCTIYDPRFPDPGRRRLAVVALAAFNDVITREAFARDLPVIDLRLVCNADEDFAAPTGPAIRGGAKIVAEIAAWAARRGPAIRRSEVFAGGS
ncbi:Lysophospholipase L1 [Belnapia rosea]|uniref:Lysophospholipase L1 n=2 Tax=Belnapia rosea TaxID=938405 RepID=A0A1G6VPL1_9PROT|nr:Lysophospholipase L1 [Belnapia rosea]